jgi:lipoprotein-releasing system ATP-binding protein
MLELNNISKVIQQQTILNDISFKIEKNQLVSILGPSGSGKSTLLHIIGTLLSFDSGEILFEGHPYSQFKEKDLVLFRNLNLGFVYQFHNLLGEFTCKENILLPLYIREFKISQEEENYFDLIVERLGIMNLLKKLPSQISGGEQQRVAVARALINKPRLLLADEPTGNLDNENAKNLYDLFLEIKEEFKQTILMVTHNEELTIQSDQIIYLNSGKIIS